MSFAMTLSLMAVAFVVFIYAIITGRRPHIPGRPPLIPPGFLLFISLLLLLMLMGHVITHLTGEPYRGRF